MNIYNNHNYGDNYTLQAGATVVARSGLEEAWHVSESTMSWSGRPSSRG